MFLVKLKKTTRNLSQESIQPFRSVTTKQQTSVSSLKFPQAMGLRQKISLHSVPVKASNLKMSVNLYLYH